VATRRATAFASAALTAPETAISAVSVAPSPSATICRASSAQTSRRQAANAASSRPQPAAPLESRTTASLVEHSPSTEIALKLSSTAGARNARASPAPSG
jgi:hypothetical protein